MNIHLDTRDFDRKFGNYMDNTSKDAVREGLGKAGESLMNDVLWEGPKAPELTSALRSSMSVFVNKFLRKTSIAMRKPDLSPDPKLKPLRSWMESIPPNTEQAAVVVNVPYATLQHEKFHIGYMSKKLYGNAQKYLKLIAVELKKVR